MNENRGILDFLSSSKPSSSPLFVVLIVLGTSSLSFSLLARSRDCFNFHLFPDCAKSKSVFFFATLRHRQWMLLLMLFGFLLLMLFLVVAELHIKHNEFTMTKTNSAFKFVGNLNPIVQQSTTRCRCFWFGSSLLALHVTMRVRDAKTREHTSNWCNNW